MAEHQKEGPQDWSLGGWKDPNSKCGGWFLLDVYLFHTMVKLKNPK
jgi:hypothetical protein